MLRKRDFFKLMGGGGDRKENPFVSSSSRLKETVAFYTIQMLIWQEISISLLVFLSALFFFESSSPCASPSSSFLPLCSSYFPLAPLCFIFLLHLHPTGHHCTVSK